MSTKRTQYTEEFKKQIVTLYQNGKTYSQLMSEYGINSNTICDWMRKYAEVKMPDDTVMTAKEIVKLRKRLAAVEEENIILKKASAQAEHEVRTPRSEA